jgi:hypothetical protein
VEGRQAVWPLSSVIEAAACRPDNPAKHTARTVETWVEPRLMPAPAEWEYHAEQMPDEADLLDQSMKLWSDAGWELVTASCASTHVRQGNIQVWQTKHMLFWRRRLFDATNT